MDHRQHAQWRRVHGSRALWTVGPKPPPAWDGLRQWARSCARHLAAGAQGLRALVL